MTHRASDSEPVDLGTAVAPDPFWIQPGVIVLERLCVIGHVRHTAEIWRVPVTDLRRELGAPPNHRMELNFIPVASDVRSAVRAALSAHQPEIRRVEAVVEVERGLVLLVTPADLAPLTLPLRHQDACSAARVLSAILAQTHRAGVVGLRFDVRDLRIDPHGDLQFASWRHLMRLAFGRDPRAADRDLEHLVALIAGLGNPVLEHLLTDPPRTSAGLAERLASAGLSDSWRPPPALLPAIAPFVGREIEILKVHQGVAAARHDGPEVFRVTGAPGAGLSRFVDELALEFGRGDGVLAIRATFKPGSPDSGLGVLIHCVADAVCDTRNREREELVARIRRTVGPFGGLVSSFSTKLAEVLGSAPVAPPLALDEAFVRHGSTIADLLGCIGSPRRPVVLLLDGMEHADASTKSVLYHLLSPGRRHHMAIVYTAPTSWTLVTHRRPVTLPLGPLGTEAMAELVRMALPGAVERLQAVVARLLELSGGLPGQAWRFLQEWVETGVLAREPDGSWVFRDGVISHANVHVLPSRLATLAEGAKRVALLVAIRAEPVPPHWVAQVIGWEPAETRAALAALIDRGLVVADPSGRIGFPDDGARAQLVADASPPLVRQAHAAIYSWLGSLDASAVQRAWHLEHATEPGHVEALAELHVAAGLEHLQLSNAERAAWHFARALERTTDPVLLRRAREARGDARVLQGRPVEALEDYQEVISELTPHDALVLANRAVHAFYLKGSVESALALARLSLEIVGQRLPTSMVDALWDVLGAGWSILWRRKVADPLLADELAMLHPTLVATAAASHPHIGLSSLFRGLAAATGRTSGQAARARAFFSTLFASMGLERATRKMLATAEAEAAADPNPMFLGVVLHFRGQHELAFGNYVGGQKAYRDAIDQFRKAGDLSVGVISVSLAILYSLDREPAAVLLQRIAEAETMAWRQRNEAALPLIVGMKLFVHARCGQVDRDAVLAALDREPGRDLLMDVLFDSFVTMCAIEIDPDRALRVAARARARLDGATARPPFLEVALVAETRALIAAKRLPEARASLASLKRRARSIQALQTASRVCEALLAIAEGQPAAAREVLAHVVDSLPSHGEEWHALEAHQLLARLLGGTHASQAHAHLMLASEILARIGVAPVRAPAPPVDDGLAPPQVEDVPIWTQIEDLVQSLRRSVPDIEVHFEAAAGVRALGDRTRIELLVVNLILAIRDCTRRSGAFRVTVSEVDLTPDEAASFVNATSGRWARISVTSAGEIGPGVMGALQECQALCADLGGFLAVETPEGSIALNAHVPAPDGAPSVERPKLAVVVHRDERLQRTLVEGIRRHAWTALVLAPDEALPGDAAVVFVEGALADVVHAGSSRVVRLVKRTDAVEGEHLRLPYALGELEALLRRSE